MRRKKKETKMTSETRKRDEILYVKWVKNILIVFLTYILSQSRCKDNEK